LLCALVRQAAAFLAHDSLRLCMYIHMCEYMCGCEVRDIHVCVCTVCVYCVCDYTGLRVCVKRFVGVYVRTEVRCLAHDSHHLCMHIQMCECIRGCTGYTCVYVTVCETVCVPE